MTQVSPAIILRTIDYGESDRVVTLLAREGGRLSALARGARRSQRRFPGGLGMGTVGEAAWRDRRGSELAALDRFEPRDAHTSFGTDVARTAHAAYALELALKLSAARQSEPALYDFLEAFLHELDAHGATAERLRVLEMGLLGRLGFAPMVAACASCGRADLGDEDVRWDAARGGVLCRSCARQGRLLPAVVRRALERVAAIPVTEAGALALPREVNVAVREALAEAITLHAPGPLRSLAFMAKLGARTA